MRKGRRLKGEANIRGSLGWVLGDKVLGFSGDIVGGGSEVSHGSQCMEDNKEGVANGIV